jgi:hypothetical protein
MVSAAFYREEARRARRSAASTHDPEAAIRWRRIAEDYETLADALASEEASIPTVDTQQQQQQQQVQQQQSKADPEPGDKT